MHSQEHILAEVIPTRVLSLPRRNCLEAGQRKAGQEIQARLH